MAQRCFHVSNDVNLATINDFLEKQPNATISAVHHRGDFAMLVVVNYEPAPERTLAAVAAQPRT